MYTYARLEIIQRTVLLSGHPSQCMQKRFNLTLDIKILGEYRTITNLS